MTGGPGTAESAERLDAGIAGLAELHDPGRPGWTRTVFSEPYREARGWVREHLAAAGLEVWTDAAGNILGRLPGRDPGRPPLVTGSHTDTVQEGGRFDGVVGVLGAVEAVRRLRAAGTVLEHDLLVVDFLGEEPNDFGLSCLGSRALSGELTPAHLDLRDAAGRRLGDRYREAGLDPAAALAAGGSLPTPHAYVELHVEQGPVLEDGGTEIGVVTGIAGIRRVAARFTGRADHAGTRPMTDRHDALVAAAQAVLAVRRAGCGAPEHGVATASRVDVPPGSPNVVPATVSMQAEMRSVDPGWLDAAERRLAEEIRDRARAEGVDVDLTRWVDGEYGPTTPTVRDAVVAAAEEQGLSWAALPSGATHDAVHLARLGPMGMIFVPSHDGRSHCPEEWTATDDVVRGVDVLVATLRRLDGAGSAPR